MWGFQPYDPGSTPGNRICYYSDQNFKGKLFYSNVKFNKKLIALERMEILIKNAISNARNDPKLAERQALIAKKISTRYRIPMSYEMKITFCKKCKSFIAPGINSKIRLGRSDVKSIRITCRYCSHTYRKIISQ